MINYPKNICIENTNNENVIPIYYLNNENKKIRDGIMYLFIENENLNLESTETKIIGLKNNNKNA